MSLRGFPEPGRRHSNVRRSIFVAIGEPSLEFSQIVCSDRLAAQRAERADGVSCQSQKRISWRLKALDGGAHR